ncbi:NAD(P)-dependent oxidoreductase [Flavobacterium sp. '19STA2R22 D10 B1']|uniref:NAD(P)-dependent oxidoreductase n=1 Tax=Flavobacterium aerium TaxID=3037261 RepID=UPI00278C45E1|nr:NAD(P)-dependent oxidoreductase [Flavobacterium sp. '19STA2R22 D10 B1']
MKFGIIKERKSPPDRRAVFAPEKLKQLEEQFPEASVKVEKSDIRIFTDEQYAELGLEVTEDMSDCDVLIGVKEVPLDFLIPNKKYFFFSHTIKKQSFNRKLLQAVLAKNIELYDHETIVDEHHHRLIGFGRYAGLVGAYNGIRAFGLKFELFKLPKAETLSGKEALVNQLKKLTLPNIKIVVTGHGKVGMGVKEMLDAMKIKQVNPDNFLTKNYASPVYTQIDVLDYNKRKDGKVLNNEDFYTHPEEYISDFKKYSEVSDIYMAGHFYGTGSPEILTNEMMKGKNFNLKVIADISCDVNGPIASTVRSSTIAEPLYGYHPQEEKEIDMFHPAAVVVMAVDNLPCELPKDSTEGFGEMFMEHVVPAFFNGDKDEILHRAKITENGKLTERFKYLQDYVDGK